MSGAKSRWAVGLISGTSMDGIDAALVSLSGPTGWPTVRLHAFRTVPYPVEIRDALMRVAGGSATTTEEISRLNFILGERFAAAALAVCRMRCVSPQRLWVIG
ncbi:MAG TPA: anhydro-N-acetylmuramic acid kinase, partial [Terriglobia bacterium]|nr:anhydro-N-acetylmuramic acid kinase [Terriglobia bacterium]